MRWIAPSTTSAALAVVFTLLILGPLSLMSFAALARKRAASLTGTFLASVLLLLLPVRLPDVMAASPGRR